MENLSVRQLVPELEMLLEMKLGPNEVDSLPRMNIDPVDLENLYVLEEAHCDLQNLIVRLAASFEQENLWEKVQMVGEYLLKYQCFRNQSYWQSLYSEKLILEFRNYLCHFGRRVMTQQLAPELGHFVQKI